ncbi:MAG: nuclear transport factor 2 family protein [Acidobacteriota bacterium]
MKIELSKDGKLVYTDYLSLLKFDSGWRIVAKVYHSHKD